MDKIIKPISYKKMAEKYTKPAFSYKKKLKEGYGAGYSFTLFDIKVQNVKLHDVKLYDEKEHHGDYADWKEAYFDADVVPGDYDWEADHPLWGVSSPDNAGPVQVTGGKVKGFIEYYQANTSEEQMAKNMEYGDEYVISEGIGGGYAHSDMTSPFEAKEVDRGTYVHGIDKSSDYKHYNDGYITEVSIDLDVDWINDCIYDAMHPEEDVFWDEDRYDDYDPDEDYEDEEDEEVSMASDARHPNFTEAKKSKKDEDDDMWDPDEEDDDDEYWAEVRASCGYFESKKSKGKKLKESYYANIEDYLMNRKGSTISFDDLLKAYKAKFGDVPTYKVGWDVYNFLGDHIDQTAFLDDVCNDYGYSDAWVYSDDAANIMQDEMDDLASKIDDRLAESKKSKGKKFKEDSYTNQVRQDVLAVSAAKKKVDQDVAILDNQVDNATKDILKIALNHRPAIREAQTRFVELDSPLNISKDGQISENDTKKILRKLAADKNLRANASYSVKDADGKVTYWDFLKSQDPNYQYVFLMEMTGGYTWCNMLFLNKKRGKVDMKNTLWDSYSTEGYERVYDKEEVLHESNRLTHKIVLKPENSGYRLTYADKLRFHSLEDAQKKLDDLNAQMGARLASKGLSLEIEEIPQSTKPRNTRTSDPDYENPFEVGDILEGDFGWSMILPAWVEVMSKTNKMVTVRRLKSKVISHDGYGQAGTKMPIPGDYETDWNGDYREKRCLVKKGYNRTPDPDPKKNYIIDYDGKMFQIWDGKAADFDTYD